jgi:hypothetical protein
MDTRERALWAATWVITWVGSVAILIAPAVWNGFPLLQYDTGGYLAPWFEGILEINRSVPYGLILVLGHWPDFWPVLVIQSLLTIWVLALTLRALGYGGRPLLLLGLIVALSLFTTLPWLTAILLTDIFAGLSVLALYLLLLRDETLSTAERYALVFLVAVSAATHSGTMVMLLGLLACATIVWLVDSARIPYARLLRVTAALLIGTAMVLATNWAVTKKLMWTPGGYALSFGRMLEDGIVKRYLDDHCPDATLKMCSCKDAIPKDADDYFWGAGSCFNKFDRFEGMRAEMKRIALESLAEYPLAQIKSVVTETLKQLVLVETGAGVVDSVDNTYDTIKFYAPEAVPAMKGALQQRNLLSFDAINRFQVPLAWLTLALLPVIIVVGFRRAGFADIGQFAAAMALAIFGNAAVFGLLATAHNRYGARIVWLAALAVALALIRAYERRGAATVR